MQDVMNQRMLQGLIVWLIVLVAGLFTLSASAGDSKIQAYCQNSETSQIHSLPMTLSPLYGGLGLYLARQPGYLIVSGVMASSPAAEAVKVNDRIVAINQHTLADLSTDAIISQLDDKLNSTVELQVLRGQDTLTVTLQRGQEHSARYGFVLRKGAIERALPVMDKVYLPDIPVFLPPIRHGKGIIPMVDTQEQAYSFFPLFQNEDAIHFVDRFAQQRPSESMLPFIRSAPLLSADQWVNTVVYTQPDSHCSPHPVTIRTETVPSPFRQGYHLLHVHIRITDINSDQQAPVLWHLSSALIHFYREQVIRYRLFSNTPESTLQDFSIPARAVHRVTSGESMSMIYEIQTQGLSDHPLGELQLQYAANEQARPAMLRPTMLRPTMLRPIMFQSLILPHYKHHFSEATSSTQLAIILAYLADKLRTSYWSQAYSYSQLHALYQQIRASSSVHALPIGALLQQLSQNESP